MSHTQDYDAKLIERDTKIAMLQRANKLLVEKDKADTKLIKKLTEVVEDFMPNIGQCALQDYDRLNEALNESDKRLKI